MSHAAAHRITRYRDVDHVGREIVRTIDHDRTTRLAQRLAVRFAREGGARLDGAGHPDLRDADNVARALYASAVRRIVYKRDPRQVELVQSLQTTVHDGVGDCEDFVVWGGSLLSAAGVDVRVVLADYSGGGFEHTYLEYAGRNGWTAWDPTLGPGQFGKRAGEPRRRRVLRLPDGGGFGLAGPPARRPVVTLGAVGGAAFDAIAASFGGYGKLPPTPQFVAKQKEQDRLGRQVTVAVADPSNGRGVVGPPVDDRRAATTGVATTGAAGPDQAPGKANGEAAGDEADPTGRDPLTLTSPAVLGAAGLALLLLLKK